MSLHRKISIAAGCALVLFGAGCSGINAQKSVSPASFLIPGLIRVEPARQNPDATLLVSEPETQPVQS